ncbi:MAG: YbaK/EbsC family protein [Oryzihumus sp.]
MTHVPTAAPEPVLDHPAVQRVATALSAFGVRGTITVLDDAARTARQAAVALGVDPAQIANSLVFKAHRPGGGEESLLVLTSGAHRVDTVKVADLVGLEMVERADPAFVLEHTGFPIGGVPPVAHLRPPATLVDVSLARYDRVWAAAGHPHAVFPTSYDELLRITGGQPAEVA